MAMPAFPAKSCFDVPVLSGLVDFFNIMTYDFHGPWSNHSGHHAPLYQNPKDPGLEGSVKGAIDAWLGIAGVKPEQVNIGMAFYGYEFMECPALWGKYQGKCRGRNYGTAIKPLLSKAGWTGQWDEEAQSPYLTDGKNILSYDNPVSIANKIKYALATRGCGGVFMWECSGDHDGTSQDLLEQMHKSLVEIE